MKEAKTFEPRCDCIRNLREKKEEQNRVQKRRAVKDCCSFSCY